MNDTEMSIRSTSYINQQQSDTLNQIQSRAEIIDLNAFFRWIRFTSDRIPLNCRTKQYNSNVPHEINLHQKCAAMSYVGWRTTVKTQTMYFLCASEFQGEEFYAMCFERKTEYFKKKFKLKVRSSITLLPKLHSTLQLWTDFAWNILDGCLSYS